MDKICGIYKITNTINNKFYIGSSIDIYTRWQKHKYYLKNNQHHSIYLQRAWNKYGKESFKFEILEICKPEERVNIEQHYLDSTQCYNYKVGYNMSHSSTGNQVFGQLNPNYGKYWTDEQKKRMSDIKKGTKHTEEFKEKLRNHWAIHPNPMAGKTGKLAPCYGRTGDKHPLYGKRGAECKASKRVICLTTGELFDSATIASQAMNTNHSKLCMCCRGKRKTSGKLEDGTPLTWKYYEDYLKLKETESLFFIA